MKVADLLEPLAVALITIPLGLALLGPAGALLLPAAVLILSFTD